MVLEIVSRVLAVMAAVAFALVLAGQGVPLVPKGRWTVAVLFALGLVTCTVAGIRDGLGTSFVAPTWLTTVNAMLGVGAVVVLIAVLIGFSWRMGVALLAAAIGASWISALAFAITAGLPGVWMGIVTLLIALVSVALVAWRPTVPRALEPVR